MNAKQAKFLRRTARTLATQDSGYVTTQHRERLVNTGELNADGTPKVRVVKPITIRNSPEGVRGTYRTLKKLAK